MSNGFKDDSGKFHPITQSKGVRKSRDQKAKTKGVKVNKRKTRQIMQLDMSEREKMEWERVVGSEVVKVKHEMMNGMPVTSVRFANGEEWFEFDKISHQEEFMKNENIEVDERIIEEFVEVDHPDISGYITMATGKVLFGEREGRNKRDGVRLDRGQFNVGDIVMVSPDNDNEGYDSFRGKKLRIVHKATSTEEHQGFDEGLEGEGLYDFETLDGESIGSSLYDYELVKA